MDNEEEARPEDYLGNQRGYHCLSHQSRTAILLCHSAPLRGGSGPGCPQSRQSQHEIFGTDNFFGKWCQGLLGPGDNPNEQTSTYAFDIRAGFSYQFGSISSRHVHVTLESASGRRDVNQQIGGVPGRWNCQNKE